MCRADRSISTIGIARRGLLCLLASVSSILPSGLARAALPAPEPGDDPGWAGFSSGWQPGCYTAHFHEEGQAEPYYNLVQVIVRPPAPSGDVLVKLGTNTWQAYNEWGGHSFYPSEDST